MGGWIRWTVLVFLAPLKSFTLVGVVKREDAGEIRRPAF